jgi:DNA-binding MarR family transcriptional regulator
MNSAQHLLNQIRRKQLLVCAYSKDGEEPTSLTDLASQLQIEIAECERLVSRLTSRGLLAIDGHEVPERVKLTQTGHRLLEKMVSRSTRETEIPALAPV